MSDPKLKLEEGTFLDRLRVKRAELAQDVLRLGAFLDTPPFYQLPQDERIDLRLQLSLQQRLLGILVRRVNRLVANN